MHAREEGKRRERDKRGREIEAMETLLFLIDLFFFFLIRIAVSLLVDRWTLELKHDKDEQGFSFFGFGLKFGLVPERRKSKKRREKEREESR